MKDLIKVQIKGIELLDNHLIVPTTPIADIKEFRFDISIEQKFNLDNKLIFVVPNITITDETKVKFGSIKVNVIFEANDLTNFIDSKTNQVNLPNEIVQFLNSIALSTTRGVMFSQFKGTFLYNAILPILDLSEIKILKFK